MSSQSQQGYSNLDKCKVSGVAPSALTVNMPETRCLKWMPRFGLALSACVLLVSGCELTGGGIFEPLQRPQLVVEKGAVEGPAWHPVEGLFISGYKKVNRLRPDNTVELFDKTVASNGLYFDRAGRLYAVDPYANQVLQFESDGTKRILADNYKGKKLNSPNDLTMDSKGRIYFTDPRYGMDDRHTMEILDEQGRRVEGVYRIDPDGTITQILAHEVGRPNGLAVSHGDEFLYVADNENTVGGARKLWRFNLLPDGSVDLTSQRLLYDWGTSRGPDGMTLDREGRIYVAAGRNGVKSPIESGGKHSSGIYVFSQEGEFLHFAGIPGEKAVSNCTFGGPDLRTLYVTAFDNLWSLRTRTPGVHRWGFYASR